MKNNLIVLAGGSGQRLWPLSTSDLPKQFLKKSEELSLFQKTIERNKVFFEKIIILSQEKYFFLLLDQLFECDHFNLQLFLEPTGKGTLPILILSLLNLPKEDFFFVTPSDHEIINKKLYIENLKQNFPFKRTNELFLFGKKPLTPHTGYGYILHENNKVVRFIEKPELSQAKILIENSNIFWNCGMLYGKVSEFLQLVKDLQPAIFQMCVKLDHLKKREYLKHFVTRYPTDEFNNLSSISIDQGILEHAPHLKAIEAEFDWKDCGTIDAFINPKINSNNLTLVNSKNISVSGIQKNVIVQNAHDLAIIEKDESLFVIKI